MFSKSTGTKGSTQYFYCNRSGYFSSKGKGKRNIKSQGSNKLNTYCTASITVTTDNNTGQILVTTCHTHYGHDKQLGHLTLNEQTRLDIAAKLVQGVSTDHILDRIRESVGNELKRIHLLTRQDIRNIERSFGIKTIERHEDDAISVDSWVKEMELTPATNPVIMYKKQGSIVQSCTDLNIDDFVIALHTPLQAQILQKFGQNGTVCIDSTHGTNGYNFVLTTIVVVDEFGEGYPVGWCISNREDHVVLQHFFKCIKDKTGQITPKWFMTDDASQYYNAWTTIFGPTNKLLCIWHVDKAWRKGLQLINDTNIQQTVYHSLRVLLDETQINTFEDLLEKTLQQLKNSTMTNNFFEYFNKYYAPRKQQWAKCYHIKAGINTNMYLESFHKVLKYVYMKGKTNKRVDRCIHVLLRMARDKGFDRIMKLEKGKTTKKISIINNRHNRSLDLPVSSIHNVSPSEWQVSSTTSNAIYTITLEQQHCETNCSLRCVKCQVCVHNYSCTCTDSLVQNTICKHIHLIASHNKTSTTTNSCKPLSPEIGSETIHSYIQTNTTTKETLLSKVSQITLALNTNTFSEIILKSVEQHMNSIIGLLKTDHNNQSLSSNTSFPVFSNKPTNKRLSPQRPFFSTKRKRKASVRLAKPDDTSKYNILNSLNSGKPLYISKEELTSKI